MDTDQRIQNPAEVALKIAALNDEHRQSNRVFYTITSGVMDKVSVSEAIAKVRAYIDFNEGNDPYGEHDFGSFTLDGMKLFWKIDYYDLNLEQWCDPLDRACRRMLTVMLAEEY